MLVFNFDDDLNGISRAIMNSKQGDIIFTTNLEKRGLLDIHYDVGTREYIVVFPHATYKGHAWLCFFD